MNSWCFVSFYAYFTIHFHTEHYVKVACQIVGQKFLGEVLIFFFSSRKVDQIFLPCLDTCFSVKINMIEKNKVSTRLMARSFGSRSTWRRDLCSLSCHETLTSRFNPSWTTPRGEKTNEPEVRTYPINTEGDTLFDQGAYSLDQTRNIAFYPSLYPCPLCPFCPRPVAASVLHPPTSIINRII